MNDFEDRGMLVDVHTRLRVIGWWALKCESLAGLHFIFIFLMMMNLTCMSEGKHSYCTRLFFLFIFCFFKHSLYKFGYLFLCTVILSAL